MFSTTLNIPLQKIAHYEKSVEKRRTEITNLVNFAPSVWLRNFSFNNFSLFSCRGAFFYAFNFEVWHSILNKIKWRKEKSEIKRKIEINKETENIKSIFDLFMKKLPVTWGTYNAVSILYTLLLFGRFLSEKFMDVSD